MYIGTTFGALKAATLAIGFIVVNIGCDAVFNSDNYRSYMRQKSLDSKLSKAADEFGGVGDAVKNAGCDALKRSLDQLKEQTGDSYAATKASYENKCSVPEWVLLELIFVATSIICIVVSTVYFLLPIFWEKCNTSKCLHIVDGVVQILLGVLLLIGCACLLSAVMHKYNESKTIQEATSDEAKNQIMTSHIRFYRKLAASCLGFINVIIYFALGIVFFLKKTS